MSSFRLKGFPVEELELFLDAALLKAVGVGVWILLQNDQRSPLKPITILP